MMLFFICTLLLLYGFYEYQRNRKVIGAFIFFFFITDGFHFLSMGWCAVKYMDFALIYLLGVLSYNWGTRNTLFFKLRSNIYKLASIITVYVTIEFLRTILLSEEIFSFALANYRYYISFCSFFLVQELKCQDILRLLKIVTGVTIISTFLFVLQPIFRIQIFQHAFITRDSFGGISRYRNIPYLVYFYLLYVTVIFKFKKLQSVVLLLLFIIAVLLTRHRAILMAYLVCISLYMLLYKEKKHIWQWGILCALIIAFAGNQIMNIIEQEKNDVSTIEDIQNVLNLNYRSAIKNGFENEGGTLSFRVLLFIERVEYMINNPKYLLFGLGTIHEESPLTDKRFDFILGTFRPDGNLGQTYSGDLTWLNPLMRLGIIGIVLLMCFSYSITTFLYTKCRKSKIAMGAFLFYIFLIITSFKNDQLYGNMQLFFMFLLIEYIRQCDTTNTKPINLL